MANLSIEQLEALWIKAGGDKALAPTMAAIAMGESSGNAGVVNSIGCVGLWQVNQPVWVGSHKDWSKDWLKNPSNNAAAAVAIYKAQGLTAWEAYTNGSFRKWLTEAESVLGKVEHDVASFLKGIAEGATSPVTGLIGSLLQLPKEVTSFLSALEKPVQGLMWFVNPANWARILAGVFGFILLGAGLIALGMAA